ncbi:MAG: class I SAM-dependent methyltransferase [bacterium]
MQDKNISYSKNFKHIVNKTSERRLTTNYKSILNYIKKITKKHDSLLDIGSGYGTFLNIAKNSIKVIGIEPSLNLYKNSVKKYPIKVLNLSFNKYFKQNKNSKFDVITLIHVIEHIQDPADLIKKTLLLLNKNGMLFIETPNLNSFLFKAEQHKYTFLTPPEHLFIFSKYSFFKIIYNLNNSKIVKISSYSYVEHSVKILKTFLIPNFNKNKLHRHKNMTSLIHDRGQKSSFIMIKKVVFYFIFHKIIGPIISLTTKINNKGTFLQLYIRKTT